MRLGDMTKNLTFQAPSGSPVVWTTIFTCKGAYWGLSGQEKIAAMSSGSTITGKVRIKYRPVKIKTTWRILCDGSTLGIVSPAINLGGNNQFYEIQVKEVA
jgi:SPP1 family predicted phage head-tail adaptor